MPGIYQVKTGTSQRRFAVNLDAAESRTAPLPLDELERLGVPTATASPGPDRVAASTQPTRNAELENHQKLWRWFIIATLAVLFLETGIAGWTARKQTPKLEAAA
jgi:anti-sigma-K factor RskA